MTSDYGGHQLTPELNLNSNSNVKEPRSNVCPIIPHSLLEEELEKLNVKIGSNILFLRAGMAEPGFPTF